MQAIVTPITSWRDALNDCRFTIHKEELTTDPSDDFIRRLVRSEHSPLRAKLYEITLVDIPYFVSVHLVRHHVGVQHFVTTSRPDRTDTTLTNHDIPRDTPVNHRMIINAQAIINISRQRLCSKASKETREAWQAVIAELNETDPILAKACVPSCVYRGLCPEFSTCGFYNTQKFTAARNRYINHLLQDDNEPVWRQVYVIVYCSDGEWKTRPDTFATREEAEEAASKMPNKTIVKLCHQYKAND